jgi:hypothetical protein
MEAGCSPCRSRCPRADAAGHLPLTAGRSAPGGVSSPPRGRPRRPGSMVEVRPAPLRYPPRTPSPQRRPRSPLASEGSPTS